MCFTLFVLGIVLVIDTQFAPSRGGINLREENSQNQGLVRGRKIETER